MDKAPLGQGGPETARLGLGCMSFAGHYGPATVEESHRTLKRALELGITHLDTARVYGDGVSEEIIGGFIREHGNRFVIATKGGIRTAPVRAFDNSPEFLRECLEGSLRRLGVEHVPLYYIHRRDQTIPIEDVTGTLARFKQEGKIGAIGFSEISPASLARAASVHPIAAVQSEYSLWTRQPELGMLQACKRLGTAFVAFSPLGRGMFGATDPDPATFAGRDIRPGNPALHRRQLRAQPGAGGEVPRPRRSARPCAGKSCHCLGDEPRAACPCHSGHQDRCASGRACGGREDCAQRRNAGGNRSRPARRLRPWRPLQRGAGGWRRALLLRSQAERPPRPD